VPLTLFTPQDGFLSSKCSESATRMLTLDIVRVGE
jgi:hypothetical protein